jgi:uncharacterized membrane protein YraQ (UPF0718 family)
MNSTFVFVNLFAFICLLLAFRRDREKTRRALVMALRSFLRILPMVIATIILIGLILGFVSKERISEVIGEQAGIKGVLIVASLGAILHIPSIISFPLAASLLRGGASVTSVAVFITTLTMIGIVTLPVEIKELGRKFAILRNSLSFIIAILIGLIMGRIL